VQKKTVLGTVTLLLAHVAASAQAPAPGATPTPAPTISTPVTVSPAPTPTFTVQMLPPREDHFGLIFTGALTLFSALATIWLTSYIEGRRELARIPVQEAARQKTEFQVKLHDLRLVAYAKFNAAASDVFTAALLWISNNGAPGSSAAAIAPYLALFNSTFQKADLLASDPVRTALRNVHTMAATLAASGAGITVANAKVLMAGRTAAEIALDKAMQNELSVV
jgi:hypothetical protein